MYTNSFKHLSLSRIASIFPSWFSHIYAADSFFFYSLVSHTKYPIWLPLSQRVKIEAKRIKKRNKIKKWVHIGVHVKIPHAPVYIRANRLSALTVFRDIFWCFHTHFYTCKNKTKEQKIFFCYKNIIGCYVIFMH